MTAFLDGEGFRRRAVVLVEDQSSEIDEILPALVHVDDSILDELTVVFLARSGPKTLDTCRGWLKEYPEIQLAASLPDDTSVTVNESSKLQALPPEVFDDASGNRYANVVAGLLRPHGLLIQDVHFDWHVRRHGRERQRADADESTKWWDTLYWARAVRGAFSATPPDAWFLTGQSGDVAGFYRDVKEAGFRRVYSKQRVSEDLGPDLKTYLRKHFGLLLEYQSDTGERLKMSMSSRPEDIEAVNSELDLVHWDLGGGRVKVGGKAFKDDSVTHLDGTFIATWGVFVNDRLIGGKGISGTVLGNCTDQDPSQVVYAFRQLLRDQRTDQGTLRTPSARQKKTGEKKGWFLAPSLRVGRAKPSAFVG